MGIFLTVMKMFSKVDEDKIEDDLDEELSEDHIELSILLESLSNGTKVYQRFTSRSIPRPFSDHLCLASTSRSYKFYNKIRCCLSVENNIKEICLWNACLIDIESLNLIYEDLIRNMKLNGVRNYVKDGVITCDIRVEDNVIAVGGNAFVAYVEVIVYGIRESFNELTPLFYVSSIEKIK